MDSDMFVPWRIIWALLRSTLKPRRAAPSNGVPMVRWNRRVYVMLLQFFLIMNDGVMQSRKHVDSNR